MPRPRTTSIIPVRLPIPVVEAVKASAEREGLSVNRFVGDIITEAIREGVTHVALGGDGDVTHAVRGAAQMMNTIGKAGAVTPAKIPEREND